MLIREWQESMKFKSHNFQSSSIDYEKISLAISYALQFRIINSGCRKLWDSPKILIPS